MTNGQKKNRKQGGTTTYDHRQSGKRKSMELFVAHLSLKCKSRDLYRAFSKYATRGAVTDFRAIIDRDTGLCKSYGFATFEDEEDALDALESLRDRGRTLRIAGVRQRYVVEPARPRRRRQRQRKSREQEDTDSCSDFSSSSEDDESDEENQHRHCAK